MRKTGLAASSFGWVEMIAVTLNKGDSSMFRFIRISLLGLVLALPFAMPQSSEASFWYRPLPYRPVVVVNPIRVWNPVPVYNPIRVYQPIRVYSPIGVWHGPVFYRR
jgi:hypothetical protein